MFASTGQGFLGYNMFAYCGNNPISYVDSLGTRREPSMMAINDPGFSYITDQDAAPWGDIPLGSSTVGRMGCGLVAIYNAMLSLRNHKCFSEIYSFFEQYPSGTIDHGKNGLNFLYVAAYFKHQGYDVVLSWSGNPVQFEQYSQAADACIMLYQAGSFFQSSGHFVEYTKHGNSYVGRNTSDEYGITYFPSPVEYGLKGSRYMVIGIFIFQSQ